MKINTFPCIFCFQISEVKEHTKEQKLHKTLTSFFISPPEKVDIAVQTDEVETIKTEKINETPKSTNSTEHQSNNSTVTIKTEPLSNDFNIEGELASSNLNFETKTPLNDFNNDAELTSSNLNSGTKPPPNDLCLGTKNPSNNLSFGSESPSNNVSVETLLPNDLNLGIDSSKNLTLSSIPDSSLHSQIMLDESQTFDKTADQNFLDESAKTKADDSQDSLFQTMEDMFCESDDSSDIMTLIEKHSSSSRSENPCPKVTPKTPKVLNNFENKIASRGHKRKHISRVSSTSIKSKRQNSTSSPVGFNELKGVKYKKKVNEIWLVERVNQTSKLKAKMMEISLLDYRKYGRIKDKFLELFGESDAEDTLPDSPVCIEEHLQACKERIAPWIVKHLTPFYKHKRIFSRELFKTTCRHVTDMLIINDTFPGKFLKFLNSGFQTFLRGTTSLTA